MSATEKSSFSEPRKSQGRPAVTSSPADEHLQRSLSALSELSKLEDELKKLGASKTIAEANLRAADRSDSATGDLKDEVHELRLSLRRLSLRREIVVAELSKNRRHLTGRQAELLKAAENEAAAGEDMVSPLPAPVTTPPPAVRAEARIRPVEKLVETREIAELTASLEAERLYRKELEQELRRATLRAEQADSMEHEAAAARSTIAELLKREEALKAELAESGRRARREEALEKETVQQAAALREARERERKLETQLEEVRIDAALASTAEAQLAEVRQSLESSEARENSLQKQIESLVAETGKMERELEDARRLLAEAQAQEADWQKTAEHERSLRAASDAAYRDAEEARTQALNFRSHEEESLIARIAELEEQIAKGRVILKTPESMDLRKFLAETLENDLARHESALAEIERREKILRSQLEGGGLDPARMKAIEMEMASQKLTREEIRRREGALHQLLDETLRFLRGE